MSAHTSNRLVPLFLVCLTLGPCLAAHAAKITSVSVPDLVLPSDGQLYPFTATARGTYSLAEQLGGAPVQRFGVEYWDEDWGPDDKVDSLPGGLVVPATGGGVANWTATFHLWAGCTVNSEVFGADQSPALGETTGENPMNDGYYTFAGITPGTWGYHTITCKDDGDPSMGESKKLKLIGFQGDYNHNGIYDPEDITILSQQVQHAGNNPQSGQFDLDGNGRLDPMDRVFWVEQLAQTAFGDADLDGTVSFTDFVTLADHFNQPGGWGQGDFSGNMRIDFPDFAMLAEHFGQGSRSMAAAAVPEPSSCVLALAGLCAIVTRRRRRIVTPQAA